MCASKARDFLMRTSGGDLLKGGGNKDLTKGRGVGDTRKLNRINI